METFHTKSSSDSCLNLPTSFILFQKELSETYPQKNALRVVLCVERSQLNVSKSGLVELSVIATMAIDSVVRIMNATHTPIVMRNVVK